VAIHSGKLIRLTGPACEQLADIHILQSPTKSPTKPAYSSASSANSTPRTGTPATTARTSDSSTKSRLSTAGRTSTAPTVSTATPAAHRARPSVGGEQAKPVPKFAAPPPRPGLAGARVSLQPRAARQHEKTGSGPVQQSVRPVKPPENEDSEGRISSLDDQNEPEDDGLADAPPKRPRPETEAKTVPLEGPQSRATTTARMGMPGTTEERTTQARVIKQLEAKVKTLQRQRQEDQEQLKSVQDLQNQSSRYEGIIQALQKKLKTNQQEIAELRAKYEEAESRASHVESRTAEHESELELAALDKEMAEERAEMFQAELEALKSKHEELELETEILREENRELGSTMNPEERASAGWLQMERETERLRQALILLRDMSQQNETDLKSEIKELQEMLDEAEKTASKYQEISEKLNKSEATNKHLMEQLEAAETNDEIVDALEAQREQNQHMIDQLKKQVQELEEHIQVTDELEFFHVEEEKRLHYQLDEAEALLNEKRRQAVERERTIEDLEYTLTKFRDVVQSLQSDIDELRRSRDISELEAHEMGSKSRAMMDLNLQLQSTAAKTQLKAIDVELGKIREEQATLHLEIVQLFVPETFEADRNPVLGLLCFKRIRSKALLSKLVLSDRLRDRPHLVQDDLFVVFEVMEKMNWVATLCDKFVHFLSSCSTEDFANYSGVLYELEPVERAITGWVEALRQDELGPDGPEHLQRMIGILVDLAEKLIPESDETKATELLSCSVMIETLTDCVGGQLASITKAVQSKLGPPKDDDADSLMFDKKMDQVGTKARTINYVSGKITRSLDRLRSRSMCLGDSAWPSFQHAEQSAQALSHLVRHMGRTVLEDLGQLEREEPLSYSAVMRCMTQAVRNELHCRDGKAGVDDDDVFTALAERLQSLQHRVDDLNNKSSDLTAAFEFERRPAPWISRAKEIKAHKILSHDMQEEMARLKAKSHEYLAQLSEKDRHIEEQQIKVELLESRAKETRIKDESVKAMKTELDELRAQRAAVVESLEKMQTEHEELLQSRESDKAELEALKQSHLADGRPLVLGSVDESATLYLKAEVDLLKAEIASLQAAVRFLKAENTSLQTPPSEAAIATAEYAWLDPAGLRAPTARRAARSRSLKAESKDVFAGLMELARTARPVHLAPRNEHGEKGGRTTWRPVKDTSMYQVSRQREDLESWYGWRDDLIKRARLAGRKERSKKGDDGTPIGAQTVREIRLDGYDSGPEWGVGVDGIRVVKSAT